MIINRIKANFYFNPNVDIRFNPGINIIPFEKIDAVKNDKTCQELLESGIHVLELDTNKNSQKQNDKKNHKKDVLEEIKKLPAEKVITIVKSTVMKETLNQIAEHDLRAGVQRAVKAQIELIDKQRKKKKEK